MATQTPEQAVSFWLNELAAARLRDKDWRKQGQKILDIYDGTHAEQTPFNILYSNTETLLPAVYSTVPRPLVQRRFKDDDPLGKAAAQAAQRCLEFLLDTNQEGYTTFDDAMQKLALDALLPGRGVGRVKYDADQTEEPGASEAEPPTIYTHSELVCVEHTRWNRVWYGYATAWDAVPWLAYEEYIDKAEAERLFGAKIAKKLTYTKEEQEDVDGDTRKSTKEQEHQGERQTCRIYQIWDRAGGKKIRYVSEFYKDDFLKVEDDPLGLTGFFNQPRPLQFFKKAHALTPTALYTIYESQAKELNELTRRIKHVTKAIRARGVYDSELGDDLKRLMQADDNELVPADKSSSLAAEKGLQNAIWFMPLETLIQTLVQLYQAREQCKQVIYEITGVSDLLRGQTQASETATAQQLKSNWGTLRLKQFQKEVQRYVRDVLRLMLELACSKFSETTWAKMTGLPFLLTPQFNELSSVAQSLRMQLAGVQPMPDQPPPPQAQQLQQILQQLQAPKWADVLALLKDTLARAYRIDIETNSTVEPEAADDQKQIADVMMALGQVMNGIGPLVAKGVLPFQAAQVMMLTIARRFRFGSELEDTIKNMQPPAPPSQDDGKEAAMQQQMKLAQQQLQMQQQQQQDALKVQQMQAEQQLQKQQMDLERQMLELQAEREKFALEKQMAQQTLALKAQTEQTKLQAEQKVASLQNTKYKTENVVNQKADATLTKGVAAMQGLVQQLVQAVALQATENQKILQTITKTMAAPRMRKAIRGKDGKIEAVQEELVA